MPSKKSAKSKRPASSARASTQNRLYGPAPFVGLHWLLGAAVTAVAIGTAGAYLVLCLMFYQNQAMLIFHPSREITTTPASVALTYQTIRFDPAQDGQPQLTGWWVPATQDGPYREDTILYLHGASGSLSDTVAQIQSLHALGINVFAIDYRGYGKSAGARPTEQTADQDTLAAWKYLTTEKKIPPSSVVVFGEGEGATFATHLAARCTVAGLVLAEISPTAHAIFEQDARARLLPLFLLAREHMNPAPALKRLKAPKLFLEWPGKSAVKQTRTKQDYAIAAAPKQLTSLPGNTPSDLADAVRPFLAQILPSAH